MRKELFRNPWDTFRFKKDNWGFHMIWSSNNLLLAGLTTKSGSCRKRQQWEYDPYTDCWTYQLPNKLMMYRTTKQMKNSNILCLGSLSTHLFFIYQYVYRDTHTYTNTHTDIIYWIYIYIHMQALLYIYEQIICVYVCIYRYIVYIWHDDANPMFRGHLGAKLHGSGRGTAADVQGAGWIDKWNQNPMNIEDLSEKFSS